jgi:hypothetical protein
MRTPGPAVPWPATVLSLALLKPGAPAALITSRLQGAYELLGEFEDELTANDSRRLYPEAYGAQFVADCDAYLASGPVRILILRARHAGTRAGMVKTQIRERLGASGLRNHLHMPDNPGETFADIAHLAGYRLLAALYERYERDRRDARMAFYRTALGIG